MTDAKPLNAEELFICPSCGARAWCLIKVPNCKEFCVYCNPRKITTSGTGNA